MAIPGINERAVQMPSFVNDAIEAAKVYGNNEKVKEVVQDAISVISSTVNLIVQTKTPTTVQQEANTTNGATGVPALDNPADPEVVEANLAALLAYLKLENDEKQSELAKARIETQKDEIEKRHTEHKEKLAESFKQMDKAAKMSLVTKIFGWLLTVLAVAFAAVVVAGSGGAAAGIAAVVGAGLAVGMQVANETGAMDKLNDWLKDLIKSWGASDRTATIVAAVTIGAVIIGVSLGCGIMGAKASMSKEALQIAKCILGTVMGVTGLANTGLSLGASVEGYKAGMANADVTDLTRFLSILRQRLEESQEELNEIIEQIQSCVSNIVALLDSATDTQLEIAKQIGEMA